MKNFIYFLFIVLLLHSLASMVGALCCLIGSQPGLAVISLVMSFIFYLIAKKYEKLWKALQ